MTVKSLIESGSKPIDHEHPLGLLLRSSAHVSLASPRPSSIYVASNDGEFYCCYSFNLDSSKISQNVEAKAVHSKV